MIDSILSSWFEIHLLVMGVALGAVLHVLAQRGYERLSALVAVGVVIAGFGVWSLTSWYYHPWYVVVPAAVLYAIGYYLRD